MADSFRDIWGRVLLRCPSLGPKLAQDFTRNAFRRLAERRRWSWLTKYGQFLAPAVYSTGTVTVTQNSTTITGSGTTFTNAMVGRQFRIGRNIPLYTVASFTSATVIEIDQPYGGATQAGVGYEIYQAFFPVPDDFSQFITLWDPAFNWQLYLNISQQEINIWDAQRASTDNSYAVSFRDYTSSQIGQIANPIQVLGSGPDPLSSGTFTGPQDAVFTVEITTSGASGTAVFRWKKDGGSYTSTVTTDAAGLAQDLQDGVKVRFPTGVTYVDDDIWVIRTTAGANAGVPRYELWPHQKAEKPYPFLYETLPTDISNKGATLPRSIRGDILLDMAIEDCTKWPGTEGHPNPYYNVPLARMLHDQVEPLLNELEVQDDNIWMQDLQYQFPAIGWEFATPLGSSDWLQSHAI